MPYIDGKRVSNDEWTARYGSLSQFHTGPNGENPAEAPEIDPDIKAPKTKAGDRRSKSSGKKRDAAIASATGQALPDITGLDAGKEENASGDA